MRSTMASRVLGWFPLAAVTVLLLGDGTNAFVSVKAPHCSLVPRHALWRHWIPSDNQVWNFPLHGIIKQKPESLIGFDHGESHDYEPPNHDEMQQTNQQQHQPLFAHNNQSRSRRQSSSHIVASFLLVASLVMTTSLLPSHAVSGGGLDFANLDITGKNFANGNYKGKDFTQVIAKGTNFANSNLQGCRFYKAYLVNADFSGADLRGASLEDTSLDNALLKDVNAAGAYFSSSILDVKSLESGDFTDAQLPLKTIPLVCERSDAKGVNPTSGVDTRESLMCP